jgi:hypothetical protein
MKERNAKIARKGSMKTRNAVIKNKIFEQGQRVRDNFHYQNTSKQTQMNTLRISFFISLIPGVMFRLCFCFRLKVRQTEPAMSPSYYYR